MRAPIDTGAYGVTSPRIMPVASSERVTMRGCVIMAARAAGLHPHEILSRDRSREIVNARQHAFFLGKSGGLSLTQIGRHWGYDHTTVLHGIRAHEGRTGQ